MANHRRQRGRFMVVALACVLVAAGVGVVVFRLLPRPGAQPTAPLVMVTITADGEEPTVVYEGEVPSGNPGAPVSAVFDLTQWQGRIICLDVVQRNRASEGSASGASAVGYVGCAAELVTPDGDTPIVFAGFQNDGALLEYHYGSVGCSAAVIVEQGGRWLAYSPEGSLWHGLRVPEHAQLRLSLALVLPDEVTDEPRQARPYADFLSPKHPQLRPRGERPTDVFIYLIDALRADHLGCYGYPRATSPMIDAFADGATFFEHAQTAATWTRPSVATLHTGLYPMGHGIAEGGPQSVLPDEAVLLPEAFREAGYRTFMVSTNPHVNPRFGFDQGYDEFIYEYHMPAMRVGETAAGMLSRIDRDQPVFMYLHTMEPHSPYEPESATFERFDRHPEYAEPAGTDLMGVIHSGKHHVKLSPTVLEHVVDLYDGEIADVDAAFGEFLDMLRRIGRYEDSLIILVADHGEAFREHGTWGHGHTLCQEEMHVPLIVRFPGAKFGGLRVAERVSLIDVFPTVIGAAGLEMPGERPLPGSDLAAIARGPTVTRQRRIFAEVSMGTGNERDFVGVIDEDGFKRVVDMSDVHGRRGPRECVGLWDTRGDPAEQESLLSAMPSRSAYDEHLIAAWLTDEADFYERGSSEAAAEISPELRRQLEALGYVE